MSNVYPKAPDDQQVDLAKTLANELAAVLLKMHALDGNGERAFDKALVDHPDYEDLRNPFAGVDFLYGLGVEHTVKPYHLIRTGGRLDVDTAICLMVLNEDLFFNQHHGETTWPEEAKRSTAMSVNCNDVFVTSAADAEAVYYDQIEDLFKYWMKDPRHGAAIWCVIARKELPTDRIASHIREAGIWDLDALTKEHGLLLNHSDAVRKIWNEHKHEAYRQWALSEGREALAYEDHWWKEWIKFTKANPGWYSKEWEAEDDRRIDEWRAANGYTIPVHDVKEHEG